MPWVTPKLKFLPPQFFLLQLPRKKISRLRLFGILIVDEYYLMSNRAVCTVKFVEAVFVLHCFQKKSKRGIATPKEDMDIIHARLKIAEAYVKELRR